MPIDPIQQAIPDLERMVRNRQDALSGKQQPRAKQHDRLGDARERLHHTDWTQLAMLVILLMPIVLLCAWRQQW